MYKKGNQFIFEHSNGKQYGMNSDGSIVNTKKMYNNMALSEMSKITPSSPKWEKHSSVVDKFRAHIEGDHIGEVKSIKSDITETDEFAKRKFAFLIGKEIDGSKIVDFGDMQSLVKKHGIEIPPRTDAYVPQDHPKGTFFVTEKDGKKELRSPKWGGRAEQSFNSSVAKK